MYIAMTVPFYFLWLCLPFSFLFTLLWVMWLYLVMGHMFSHMMGHLTCHMMRAHDQSHDHELFLLRTWVVKAPPKVGPTWMRVRLALGSDCLPIVVPEDCLISLSLIPCFFVRLHMSDIQWCRVVLVCCFHYSWFLYVPLRAVLLDHVYVHLHGSPYPMMDYTLCVYYGLLTPCLLMFHGVSLSRPLPWWVLHGQGCVLH